MKRIGLLTLLALSFATVVLGLTAQNVPAGNAPEVGYDFVIVRAYFDDPQMVRELANWKEPWEVNDEQGYLIVDVTPAEYVLDVVCERQTEAEIKALIAQAMPPPTFQLRALHASPARAADQMQLRADYATAVRDDRVAEDAVRTLSEQPGITSVRWSITNEQAADWFR